MNTNLRRMSHKVGMNHRHLEWCTKYRYKMMRKLSNKNLVEATIRKAAHEHKIKVHELTVLPEHVHMLATFPNGMSDSKALQLLKGRSAYLIFRNKEKYRLRYSKGHFWAPSSCAITVGYNDIETCRNYIREQEKHHNVAFA